MAPTRNRTSSIARSALDRATYSRGKRNVYAWTLSPLTNDVSAAVREAHERVLELEVELALLQKSLSSPSSPKANGRAKQRRLGFIWDFLVKQAKQANEIRLQRIGRLNFNTEMFVRSDLPASYIVDVGYTTHWEIASLIIARNTEVERLVRRVTTSSPSEIERDGFLASKASLRDIEAAFREYLRNVGGISSLSDVILEWRDALEYYVDLFSASDLNAFRVLRPISVETLNVDAIDSISQGLRVATQNLRGQLVSKYPEGLLELSFLPSDDPYVMDLVRLELAEL